MVIFVGSMVLLLLSIGIAHRLKERSVRDWLIVAAGLYGVTMVMTGFGIDPLGFGPAGEG